MMVYPSGKAVFSKIMCSSVLLIQYKIDFRKIKEGFTFASDLNLVQHLCNKVIMSIGHLDLWRT